MKDRVTIAKRCFLAYANSDRSEIEALIAPDFRFSSPLDNRLDRAAYMARCWPNHARIAGFEFRRLIEAGEAVVVTYEGRTVDGTVFRNTEILTIRDGQVIEAEVYFGWDVPHAAPPGGFLSQS